MINRVDSVRPHAKRRNGTGKAAKVLLLLGAVVVAVVLLAAALTYGATAPPTHVTETQPFVRGAVDVRPVSGAGVSVQDLVYFGAAWQLLSRKTGGTPIVLGSGYARARVERTDDGLFFAGIVERLAPDGHVADVILAFAGAQRLGDLIQGMSLGHGRVLAEPKWAAVLFERIWNDPRYAGARIYVTGHSLGAGYAQFVGTEAIARHGPDAVARRLRIVAFGVPNWGYQSARYFRVGPHVLDDIFTGYTARNDPVQTNGGTGRVGTSIFLPPHVLRGRSAFVTAIAAHWPTTYMLALGLPDWLSRQQKLACIAEVSRMFFSGRSYDPVYAREGRRGLVIQRGAHGIAGGSAVR